MATCVLLVTPSHAHAAASRYRLCDNPQRVYTVVAVRGTSCRTGHAIARAVERRVLRGQDTRRVLGWRCSDGKGGVYEGLAGSRVKCHRGSAYIRIDSRGE